MRWSTQKWRNDNANRLDAHKWLNKPSNVLCFSALLDASSTLYLWCILTSRCSRIFKLIDIFLRLSTDACSQVDNFDVQVKGINKTSKRYFSCWEKSIDEEIEIFHFDSDNKSARQRAHHLTGDYRWWWGLLCCSQRERHRDTMWRALELCVGT